MDKYIFIKMLYIADRESIRRWDEPITGDAPVSMKHGPVLSTVLDLTKGAALRYRGDWHPYISDADPQTNQLTAKDDPGRDELSNNEIRLLDEIYEQFKSYSWKQMKEHCHAFGEFEDVGDSSKPILVESIFKEVGKEGRIHEIDAMHHNLKFIDALMES